MNEKLQSVLSINRSSQIFELHEEVKYAECHLLLKHFWFKHLRYCDLILKVALRSVDIEVINLSVLLIIMLKIVKIVKALFSTRCTFKIMLGAHCKILDWVFFLHRRGGVEAVKWCISGIRDNFRSTYKCSICELFMQYSKFFWPQIKLKDELYTIQFIC